MPPTADPKSTENAADSKQPDYATDPKHTDVCTCVGVCVGGRGALRREAVCGMRDARCAKWDARCEWFGGIRLNVGAIVCVLRVGGIICRLRVGWGTGSCWGEGAT